MKLASFTDYLKLGTQFLKHHTIEEADISSRRLLEEVTGQDTRELLLEKDFQISKEKRSRFFNLLKRRADFYPLQYLLGKVWFRNIELKVNQKVLIPRLETELMIDILHELFNETDLFRLLDMGTGSGNIALSVADEFSRAQIDAYDVSYGALSVAMENANSLQLDDRVNFKQSDLFRSSGANDTWDVIVSNPPYISPQDRNKLQKELNYEPERALFAPCEGLEVIKRLLNESAAYLKTGGYLIFEMGAGQSEEVKRQVVESNQFSLRVFQDYQKKDRFAILKKK